MMLMAYGLLPVSEIRTLGWRSNHLPPRLEDVLRRRSPERLVPIVDFLLDDVGDRAWRVVRAAGPGGDRAATGSPLVHDRDARGDAYGGAAAEMIADDPGLLDVEVWRLFEVEGGGEDSLANHEKFFGDTWGDASASSPPGTRSCASGCSTRASPRWRATSRPTEPAGSRGSTSRSRRPTTSAPSAPMPTWGSSEAASARPCRWPSPRWSGSTGAGRLPADDLLGRIGPVLGDGPAGTAKAALGLVGRAGTVRRTARDGPPSSPPAALAHRSPTSSERRSR